MQMIGGEFRRDSGLLPRLKEPLVESWFYALSDARRRTRKALGGILPEDSIVLMLRDRHQLLIGGPTGEKVYQELVTCDSQQPRTMMVKGRSMVTGLPAQVEVSSLEVQAVDNDQASIAYLDWVSENGDLTIGALLYAIATHEFNWLYVGVLQKAPPAEVEALFTRNEEEMFTLIRGKTLSEHWHRLDMVGHYLFDTYREMTLEDFQRRRSSQNSLCSAEWVIHECCQFEAERRSEIKVLFTAAKDALDPKINK